jgi:hypothetical protein
MTSRNLDMEFSKLKPTRIAILLCCFLGFLVFLGSLSPTFFKVINNSSLIQQVMQGSNLANPASDYVQLVQVIRWLRITLIVFPLLDAILILLILFINRKNRVVGFKSTGMALLIPGIIAFVFENILYIVFSSFQGIQNYTIFLGFSGGSADVVKMITLQSGNVFLFYWGITSFGILTLGLVLILVARAFKR